MTVKVHEESVNSKSVIVTPEHEDRKESAEFRKSKERLHKDGHMKCYICGSEDTLQVQVHHRLVEWSEAGVADFEKVKEVAEEWDVYGYGKLLKDKPITSADDIRNCLVLCQLHHTGINHKEGNATGIHNLVFPFWIMQKFAKQGEDPVPQEGQTFEDVEKEIEGQ